MIYQLKNTPTKISLYDLIATSHTHREVLYGLLKNKTIPTNILAITFSKILNTIRRSDTIFFYKSQILTQEFLEECSALYITPMVEEWEVKRTMVDNGSTVNVCSNYFLAQL